MSKCYASTIIALAKTQVGYKEKETNSQLDSPTANAGDGNWTKYGRDIDTKWPTFYNGKKNGYAWCDQYVDWLFLTSFGLEDALRLLCQPLRSSGAGCASSANYYKAKGRLFDEPMRGDQIFFPEGNGFGHTGLVTDYKNGIIYTIEGNSSNGVHERTYTFSKAKGYKFGRPYYDEEVTSGNAAIPSSPTESNASGEIVYTVVAGDTLSKIAAKYATTYQELAKYNGISNPNLIHAGQKIRIPAKIMVGSKVKVVKGAKTYTGGGLASYVYDNIYTVIQINGDRVVIGVNGVVTAALHSKNLILV